MGKNEKLVSVTDLSTSRLRVSPFLLLVRLARYRTDVNCPPSGDGRTVAIPCGAADGGDERTLTTVLTEQKEPSTVVLARQVGNNTYLLSAAHP